jgi:hypothetical protein
VQDQKLEIRALPLGCLLEGNFQFGAVFTGLHETRFQITRRRILAETGDPTQENITMAKRSWRMLATACPIRAPTGGDFSPGAAG